MRSSSGLVYVIINTYAWLKEDQAKPEAERLQVSYLITLLDAQSPLISLLGARSSLRSSRPHFTVPPQHPENVMLLFGVALISAFFMYTSLFFVAIFYCKRRGAFKEADAAVEIHGQFSDCAAPGKRRPRRNKRGGASEYNSRSAL